MNWSKAKPLHLNSKWINIFWFKKVIAVRSYELSWIQWHASYLNIWPDITSLWAANHAILFMCWQHDKKCFVPVEEWSGREEKALWEQAVSSCQIPVQSHCDIAVAWMKTPLDKKQMINRQEDQLLLQLNSNLLSLACRTSSSFQLPCSDPRISDSLTPAKSKAIYNGSRKLIRTNNKGRSCSELKNFKTIK